MKTQRPIIEIDEDLCTGCGECILSCAEGALELVDGKVKLVGEILCDGLGACLGECPEGALKIVERDAEAFDEVAVERRLKETGRKDPAVEPPQEAPAAFTCPGSASFILDKKFGTACEEPEAKIHSTLGHWPIKLQLLGPQAPFLKGADLLLIADCVGIAFPEVHQRLIPGKAVALGCPKLDDLQAHIDHLAEILKGARPRSLTVVHVEVPCCHGFVYAAQQAIACAGVDIPLRRMQISRSGEMMVDEEVKTSKV
ncbi:MAG: ATP-binding protein [Planctomycetota bacterium]|jgi:Pyruvate/2-oxoacid:ferredoxin oxidoreductase delta subunit